jgi:hypothetical protein
MKSTFIIILFCCLFFKSYSQFSNYAFGDVTKEELLMTDCPFEPGAPAMIIAERCEFKNEPGASYRILRINRRIKILTKEGLSYGNFESEYYKRYTDISFFRGSVFNLENDIIVEEKTKSADAIMTKIDKNSLRFTVSLPGVKVGSVIDISYDQREENLMPIQPWYFQSDIPCGWSEYIPSVAKKANYIYHYTDFLPFAINTIRDSPQESERKGGFIINHFAVENAPSYHLNEPFILRPGEQLSKVELIFKSYNPNSIWGNGIKPLNWTEINYNLLNNPYMGKVIDKGKFLRDPLKDVLVNCSNFDDSLRKVYEYIRQTVKSNGYRSIYASNLKKVLAEKTGNTGEINLLLIAALREAGFDCHPLLLPTNEELPTSKTDPERNGINYLVAAVFKDSVYYLLDASRRELAFNSLSVKCLNGDGFLVSDHNHNKWLPLLRNEGFETQTSINYVWTPESPVTVNVEKSSFSLAANRLRYLILEEGNDEYIKSRKSDYQKYSISDPQYTGLKETDNPFVEKFSFPLKGVDYNSTDNYFVPCIPFDGQIENPFDAIKRDFQIDFLAPTIKEVDVTILIPEGYKVVNLPQSFEYSDLDDDLVFEFSVRVSENGREIEVHSGYQIRGYSYSKDEYDIIRAFFAEIVKANNSFIELTKGL